MADRDRKDSYRRLSKSASFSSNPLRGLPFHLDNELFASKSAKAAALLEKDALQDLQRLLLNLAAEPEIFQLIARFCHGYDVQLSSSNIISVFCISHYLQMVEDHSPNNLFSKAFDFIEQRIIPSWNEVIKALRASERLLKQAADLGLVDACLESIVEKIVNDPGLLGEPIRVSRNQDDETECESDYEGYRPNAKRRLFALDWNSEDLTTLSIQLYEPIIQTANCRGVPQEYIVASIWNYTKKWVFDEISGGENGLVCKNKYQRDVLEAVERVLPQGGLIPCSFLFKCLKFSILLETNQDYRNGFEIRIGKQLDKATVQDLLIPSQGYAKEAKYDVESLIRILKAFYGNYTTHELSSFFAVAKLMEEFLEEVAGDADLKMNTFVSLAEMSVSASDGIQKYSDGIYRAVDVFLETNRHLTESERFEVCKVLDCQKLSPEACEHASRNQRLPLRIVVQVLFVSQLHIRDAIAREMKGVEERSKMDGEEMVEGDEPVKMEMERISNKVMELEEECCSMKNEIQNGCVVCHGETKRKRVSIWGEVKRKFGCMSSVQQCNCQVKKKKKVHPK